VPFVAFVTGLADRLVMTATVDDAVARLTAVATVATVAPPLPTLVQNQRSCRGRRPRSLR
jgi:hypothetical protein